MVKICVSLNRKQKQLQSNMIVAAIVIFPYDSKHHKNIMTFFLSAKKYARSADS